MKLLITGATGYIGLPLADRAAADGHEVICATRTPCARAHAWLPYDLRDPAPQCPAGVQAFIHLAANTAPESGMGADAEVQAAEALIQCARQASARFIFMSSQTAQASAPTVYGQVKWRIEQAVLAAGGVVIRPGQVYGGPERGLFGLLCRLVRRFPVIPMLVPAPCVQPIHVDDLAASILAVVEREDIRAEVLSLGAVQPISFGRFLMAIATHRVHTMRLPVPVPVALLALLRRCLGQSLGPKLGLERIFSLIHLPTLDTAPSLQKLGIVLRPLADGLHRSGRGQRRQCLEEGKVLLGYLLGSTPPSSLVSRYVKALEQAGKTRPAIRSPLLKRWPVLVSLLDNPGVLAATGGQDLSWRLQAALALAEASPVGARRFLGTHQPRGFVLTLMTLGWIAAKALAWRAVTPLCRPLARRLVLDAGAPRDA
ncbi:NAD-dependent epimerase/dehydratase family protein [Pseudomonas fluorescens]|uniref:NAD-dependent epimerase/dehydratase family protein n=1 Tax=Pseudomonas fluorescens TaxID=294 RepID=UPI0009BAB893|nr:sugar nucleotide-binding protein [Pseudomonas fluorescens]